MGINRCPVPVHAHMVPLDKVGCPNGTIRLLTFYNRLPNSVKYPLLGTINHKCSIVSNDLRLLKYSVNKNWQDKFPKVGGLKRQT